MSSALSKGLVGLGWTDGRKIPAKIKDQVADTQLRRSVGRGGWDAGGGGRRPGHSESLVCRCPSGSMYLDAPTAPKGRGPGHANRVAHSYRSVAQCHAAVVLRSVLLA